MGIGLVDALRANNPDGSFDSDVTTISYKTGFPIIDYYLGYMVKVVDPMTDEVIKSYPCVGISAGSYNMFAGPTSSSKTTLTVQIAANIVRNFENGFVMHYDLEGACNYTRIKTLTKFTTKQIDDGKYIIKQGDSSIDEMYESIMDIYFEKRSNPDKYKYDTGMVDEFNKPIIMFQPTVVILDSIPTMSTYINEDNKAERKKIEELEGSTYSNRLAKEITQFLVKLLPRLKAANIILLAINQVKDKIDIGFSKSPAEILHMKQNWALPGGKAVKFYAQNVLIHEAIGSEKFTRDEDGFDGNGVHIDIIKSRTNQTGRTLHMMFDKVHGVDSVRSSLVYAKECGLVTGNKNATYFNNNKDEKFSVKNAPDEFRKRPELYKIMYDNLIPELEKVLSDVTDEDNMYDANLLDY